MGFLERPSDEELQEYLDQLNSDRGLNWDNVKKEHIDFLKIYIGEA